MHTNEVTLHAVCCLLLGYVLMQDSHTAAYLWEQVASLQLAKVGIPVDLEHSCKTKKGPRSQSVLQLPAPSPAELASALTLLSGCRTAHHLPHPAGGCPADQKGCEQQILPW